MDNVMESSSAELIQQAIDVLYCSYEAGSFVSEEVTTAIELLRLVLKKIEKNEDDFLLSSGL